MDLRFSIVLLLTFLIVGFLYRLRYKKEQQKIVVLKDRFEKERRYSTPLFNNAGFIVGFVLIFGLGLLSTIFELNDPSHGFPLVAGVGLSLFGLFMTYQTTYFKLESSRIEFQPLLFKLLGMRLSKKIMSLDDIAKVTRREGMPGSPFIVLSIYAKDGKKFKLNTAFYNSEIGNALYEFLNESLNARPA